MRKVLLIIFPALSLLISCSQERDLTPDNTIEGRWLVDRVFINVFTDGELISTRGIGAANITPSPYLTFEKSGRFIANDNSLYLPFTSGSDSISPNGDRHGIWEFKENKTQVQFNKGQFIFENRKRSVVDILKIQSDSLILKSGKEDSINDILMNLAVLEGTARGEFVASFVADNDTSIAEDIGFIYGFANAYSQALTLDNYYLDVYNETIASSFISAFPDTNTLDSTFFARYKKGLKDGENDGKLDGDKEQSTIQKIEYELEVHFIRDVI